MHGIHEVAFGGIDDIAHYLVGKVAGSTVSAEVQQGTSVLLPVQLRSCTIEVATAGKARGPDARRLFHGSPATYADIEAGLTFRRTIESVLATALRDGKTSAALLGPSGGGKTTAIRRVAVSLGREGFHVWEHNGDFPLRADDWLEFLPTLASLPTRTVILVDDCTRFQRDVNHLVDHIVERGYSNVGLLLAGHTSEWNGRIKSRYLYKKGIVDRLRTLDAAEQRSLLELIEEQPDILSLVDETFRKLPVPGRQAMIRMRASSDMFVALKYIFASDSLDDILLREFASLPDDLREIYRYVAAVHATGPGPHRQLVIRGLNIFADDVAEILRRLEDVIQEREISSTEGIYEWATRHEVIAQAIVKYKYFSDDDWFGKLQSIVRECNPYVYFEQRMLRSLCNSRFGIRRLPSADMRIALYNAILRIIPVERVAWHRLVYEYLAAGNTGAAESVIRSATEVVGADPPLQRYRVRVLLLRAEAPALTPPDRRTLVQMARQEALEGVRRFRDNRFSYEVLEDVAAAWRTVAGSSDMLEEFTPLVREAAEQLLDPALDVVLRRMEHGLPIGRLESTTEEASGLD